MSNAKKSNMWKTEKKKKSELSLKKKNLKKKDVYIKKKKKEHLLSMKMVGGRLIALPQNEQVKIGPRVNESLYITHYPLDQSWPLSLHVHSLRWPLPGITCFFYNIGQQKHVKKTCAKVHSASFTLCGAVIYSTAKSVYSTWRLFNTSITGQQVHQ